MDFEHLNLLRDMMNFSDALRHVLVEKDIPYQLKSQQLDILRHLVDKSNVLAVLPTGYGKSVLYALFPAIMDKVSCFVSQGKCFAYMISNSTKQT